MRKIGRLLALAVAGLVGIVFALAVGSVLTRAYLQHRNAATSRNRPPRPRRLGAGVTRFSG